MTKGQGAVPANLENLNSAEEQLRDKALAIITSDPRLQLHLAIVESTMDLARRIRPKKTPLPNSDPGGERC